MKRYFLECESIAGLRWSNSQGWIKGEGFTVFSESEVKRFTHIPADSKWTELES